MRPGCGRNRSPFPGARGLVLTVGVVAILAASATLAPTPSAAACAETVGTRLAGTVEGEDHRFVRSQVSIQLTDADGNGIGLDGCPRSGYGAIVHLNTDLPDGQGTNSAEGHTKDWELVGLPDNAVLAYVEVYPRGPTGTDLTRYGRALRHRRPIGDTSIDIRLPLNCGLTDNSVTGTNGTISGTVTLDGHPVATDRISAFSHGPDTEDQPRGFSIAPTITDGHFEVPALASDQPYQVMVRLTPTSELRRIWGVWVPPCTATRLDVVFGKFQDVPYSHPFFAEITWMLDGGLTAGYEDDTFRPTAEVTRQAVSTWLHRRNGQPEGPFPDPGFSDVRPGHSFDTEIWWMVESQRAEGYADETFRPTRCVTRQALAAFLHREHGSPPAPGISTFSDVGPGHPFEEAISWAAGWGIAQGYTDGTFRPGECVTRQAGAAFLQRAFA